MAEYIPLKIKKLILAASHGYCEYCWSPSEYTSAIYHFDHILPVVNGGKSFFLNLAYSCNACNSYKSDKIQYLDSVTQQICSLYHPRTDLWTDHFQWSPDFLRMEGISPTGRATIELLRVNRPQVMNLRLILKLIGLHPPF